MNFLAHIYLSGDNDLVTVGNFMADGIKGSNYKLFPLDVQTGILLHRHIDTYTDAHKIFRKSTKRLHKKYSHYSGIIVDILYDHFLAKNWEKYCDTQLKDYVGAFYNVLEVHYNILPLRIKKMIPFMIKDNWLFSYASIDGISKTLEGMNRRTKNVSGMDKAVEDLVEFYTEFENEFTHFFDELINFSKLKLIEITEQIV